MHNFLILMLKSIYFYYKHYESMIHINDLQTQSNGGSDESRTRVQTSANFAFYILSLLIWSYKLLENKQN